ncbi:MAG: alpha glucosidase [Caulobacteraceae bacterium]|nr:alpha glucosidase [Caulobacteraceae bacterium]
MAQAAQEPWWRGAVLYQIYPRSFMDADGDGIGDLAGITAKLDYVAALGVDGIWLSPIFRSPMKDFGYDVSDYCDIDPLFGTLADFDVLLAKAHRLGLKVIVDQVYSHTSDEHPWFTESAASREGPKADWYVWADPKPDGSPPNNWLSVFGGPAWTWGPQRRQYYLHNFLAEQPDLNFHHSAVQSAVLDAARFWLDRGVDGVRLDVVNYYVHDAVLRGNPPALFAEPPSWPYRYQRHLFDKSRPETLDFAARLRALTDQYPNRMMVGEIDDDEPLPRQVEYTEPGRLHTAYSFHLLNGQAAAPRLFAEALNAWTSAAGWPSWSLGNHDVPRFPTRLRGPDAPADLTNALLAALFSLRGTIFLYQGEELGLPQAHVPFDQLQDPFAKRAFVGDAGRDGARTPFPWTSAAPMGGFTRAERAWLPLDPRHLRLAAERQVAAPGSHLDIARRLIRLRAEHPALRIGAAQVLPAPDSLLAVAREAGGRRVFCLVNMSAAAIRFAHPAFAGAVQLNTGLAAELASDELRLPPYGAAYLSPP